MVLGWGKPASKYLFTHVTSQLMHQCLRLIVIICFDFAVAFIFGIIYHINFKLKMFVSHHNVVIVTYMIVDSDLHSYVAYISL